jgi:twitching motility protein PilT
MPAWPQSKTMGLTLFESILKNAVDVGASDIHLKVGLPALVRYREEIRVLSKSKEILNRQNIEEMVLSVLPERLTEDFHKGKEIDFAYSFSGVGRFRLNIYLHRGQRAMAIRFIPFEVKSLDELGLPSVLKNIALKKRGLVLITGPAGSGKSTTLAAMVEERNKTQSGHIITIEDPVEYLIRDRKAIITQREIGIDTESFQSGLKHALRQDPDVIMIGEMRDRESIEQALSAAETGHLVLSTLHTRDATETLSRILGIFPADARDQLRWQLASCLEAIVSQRMIPVRSKQQKSMVVATELMLGTPRVRECLEDPRKSGALFEAIEKGGIYGMHSFDQSLMSYFQSGILTREQVMENASRPGDLELKLRGINPSAASYQMDSRPGSKEKEIEIEEITDSTTRRKK